MQTKIGNEQLIAGLDFSEHGIQDFNYNGDGTINYIQVTIESDVYRQTFSYSNSKVSSISKWIKQ